jgi:UDP-N-acetylglucosamine 2-epimerase (non-hydrolysing)
MKIICVIGTRPEAIKMAPVIDILKKDFNVLTVSTGQHRELLDQTLKVFDLKIDIDLKIMTPKQNMLDVLSKIIYELNSIYIKEQPDMVIGQGDTTTVLAAAQASYFNKIPFAHVEAGLRTNNFENPWPEEMNRVLISKLSTLHFCPTESAKQNLIKEGYTQNLFVTGNTVIDALLSVVPNKKDENHKTILCTVHRRENFGQPLTNILDAILEIVNNNKDVRIVFPVHPNPNVKEVVHKKLVHNRIKLCEPLDYVSFCKEMNDSYIILTDSGGVQEEAPALGKPVLVLRDFTERPEAIEYGVVKLVGTNKNNIVSNVTSLLNSKEEYLKMSTGASPYGDGKASIRIHKILSEYEHRI